MESNTQKHPNNAVIEEREREKHPFFVIAICCSEYSGRGGEEGAEAPFQPDTLTVTSYKASLRQKNDIL